MPQSSVSRRLYPPAANEPEPVESGHLTDGQEYRFRSVSRWPPGRPASKPRTPTSTPPWPMLLRRSPPNWQRRSCESELGGRAAGGPRCQSSRRALRVELLDAVRVDAVQAVEFRQRRWQHADRSWGSDWLRLSVQGEGFYLEGEFEVIENDAPQC